MQIRGDSRGFPQWFLKLLETAAPYFDSLDVFNFRKRPKAVEEHHLSQNSGSGPTSPAANICGGQPEQVMIPGPLGTISPHEPVIKSETGTGFHAS
jgi:hypothetical protein